MINKKEIIEKYIAERLQEDTDYMVNMGLPLDSIWWTIEDFTDTFEGRTEIFFVLFKELLRRGHLKLQRDNKIIEHTPEEWEAIFRSTWPYQTDGVWLNVPEGYRWFDEDSIGIWLTVDAPAFAVWVDPDDGSLYWAT